MANDKLTYSVEYERKGYNVRTDEVFVEALTFSAAVTKARRKLIQLNSQIRCGSAKWTIISVRRRGYAI
jgi:uncharacterized membrane protein YGL010W